MHSLPSFRLGHLIIPVRKATWSDSGRKLSLDVQGQHVDYLGRSPSLSGVVSYEGPRISERVGRTFELVADAREDDLSLYTGIHTRPKTFAVTVSEVDGASVRARIEGTADVHWDDALGSDVPFQIDGWFGPEGPPAWLRR